MSKLSQLPDRAKNAAFLHQESVKGEKISFVQQSTVSSGSITLTTGQSGGFSIPAEFHTVQPPAIRDATTLIPFNQCIVWFYYDLFVDNNNDFNYEFDNGGLLTNAMRNIQLRERNVLTQSSTNSHELIVSFFNNDTSTHTLYITVQAKFIITATQ